MPLAPGNDIDLGVIWRSDKPLILSRRDRARHLACFGSTRSGKSKFLENIIIQDVFKWPRYRCPIVLLDPHGTLHDAIIARLAANNLKRMPVIPIDLRRDDVIVSYNLHRRRNGTDLAVVCRACADAMLRAWGQSSTDETPRLASWLFALLTFAYERECTLVEALILLRNPSIRRDLVAEVEHFVARTTFETASHLKEREFQERTESTLYRLNRFLSTQLLRAMLCQTGASLDFSDVLDTGGVVLACLSTEGTKVAEEDARTLGSVILTDLWLAARRRGKREEGALTPAYVFIDEFHRFATPTIAEGLAEASGHGLHLAAACQFPSQLADQGESGRMIFNSVLANARNKVVFQISHPADLEMLTSILYRQDVDPDQVKHEIWSTKVMGHSLMYLPSYSSGTTKGTETGWQKSRGSSEGHTVGSNWTHTDTVSESFTVSDGTIEGTTDGVTFSEALSESEGASRSISGSNSRGESVESSESTGESESSSFGTTESEGSHWSDAQGRTSGGSSARARGRSDSYRFGRLSEDLQEELRRYEYTKLDRGGRQAFQQKWPGTQAMTRDEVEDFKRRRVEDYALAESTSQSDGDSWNESSSSSSGGSRGMARSRSESRGTSHARGTSTGSNRSASIGENLGESASVARSRGLSVSTGSSSAVTHSESTTTGTSASDAYGGSKSWSSEVSQSEGKSGSASEAQSHGMSLAPVLMPIMGKELSSRQFRPIEEQLFSFAKVLDGLPDRHCVVRLASIPSPVRLYTHTVKKPLTTERWVSRWTLQMLIRLPFTLTMSDALQAVAAREKAFGTTLLPTVSEPLTARRKLTSGAKPRERESGGGGHA